MAYNSNQATKQPSEQSFGEIMLSINLLFGPALPLLLIAVLSIDDSLSNVILVGRKVSPYVRIFTQCIFSHSAWHDISRPAFTEDSLFTQVVYFCTESDDQRRRKRGSTGEYIRNKYDKSVRNQTSEPQLSDSDTRAAASIFVSMFCIFVMLGHFHKIFSISPL